MGAQGNNNQISVIMLVIGDEILNGRTKDLNAQYLAKFLQKNGLHFKRAEFIRDDEIEFRSILTKALLDADIIITSGGIGPTLDDLTKKCLADYFSKPIEPSYEVEKVVTKNYERFMRTWVPGHNYYHHFPKDFLCFNNPKGLAPGLGFFDEKTKKLVLAAPGVPREFEAMVSEEFFPTIQNLFSHRLQKNYQTIVRTHSVPEEKIFGELCPELWEDLSKFGKVSSLPHIIGIDIIVSYTGDDKTHLENQQKIHNIFKNSNLKDHIWQFGNLDLNQLLLNTLLEKKITIGFAESCTGGLCSSKITDLSGASDVFMGSIICYSNEIKHNTLAVNKTTLEKHGAVSIEVAKEMALGAREKLGVDIAVSVTGIAGPLGGSVDKPVGTVCFGVASKNHVWTYKHHMPGDRVKRKDRFSEYALWLLYKEVIEHY